MITTRCPKCNSRIVSPDGLAECGICNRPAQGLGDTIETALDKVGGKQFKKAYKAVTGKDCGCNKRKQKLNEMFPYKGKTNG